MTLSWKPALRFILFVLLAAVLVVGVAATLGVETRSGEWVEVTGEHDDMVFAAGGNVKLSLTTPDDVFAAGGDIEVIDLTADHLSMAGGDLTLSGIAVRDVLAAGGNLLVVSGRIEDDLVAAAADISLGQNLKIGGSAVVSGADISISSAIVGEVRAAGEIISIDSEIGGDVLVEGGRVRLGPNARINGDFRHRTKDLQIEEGALVVGDTIALGPRTGPNVEPVLRRAAVMAALFGVLFLLGLVLLVIVAVLALPAIMNRSRDMLSARPLQTIGIGFLTSLIGPALIVFLVFTVFGIPLAMLIGMLFLALVPLALAGSIYWLGMQVRQSLASRTKADRPSPVARVLWTALAALALILVGIVPVLGGVVWTLAFIFGLGAVGTQIWRALSGDETNAAAA